MKKSTMAVAALLTALSAAPVMSVAYADDAPSSSSSSVTPCAGKTCAGSCAGSCAGKNCAGADGSNSSDDSKDE